MGFKIDDTKLKRAGLDYWPYVVVEVHASWAAFADFFGRQDEPKRLIGFSKRGSIPFTQIDFQQGDWLLFGSETEGLSPEAWAACAAGRHAGGLARIPINETFVRSLNLSVAVGVAAYEACRQLDAAAAATRPAPSGHAP